RGEPLRCQLGVGLVISGWDLGVQGLTVGGRRRLEIPASLGYGAQGAPPVIAPNESLIFVCDLVAVHKR
ncbi:MAG: FKBP-type peptidyl-prolyl cis-trans isomerase, partial [Dermabacteraceae bacterium]